LRDRYSFKTVQIRSPLTPNPNLNSAQSKHTVCQPDHRTWPHLRY
jgi:hypothetical protein